MPGPIYPGNSTKAATEPEEAHFLTDPTFDVDAPKFYDPTFNIRPGAKSGEDPDEASREDDEKKEASVAEKECSNRKETTDDPSVSVTNDTDPKPEEAQGMGRERIQEGTEVNATMGLLMPLKAGLNKMREIGKQLIAMLKVPASFAPHRTAHAVPDEPTRTEAPAQFATDSGTESSSASNSRHNSEAEKENPESSKRTGFQDSLRHNNVASPHLETTPVLSDFEKLPDLVLLQIFKWIGVRDRLRLEGVNRRWQRLLMESWKDVRVL